MDNNHSINVNEITKDYQFFEKEEGLRGSLKSLFNRRTQIRRALDAFSFHAAAGEMIGLIGPNGAGKTTLIKILTGIIQPTSGTCDVLGFTPSHAVDEYKRQFALVMGQKSQLWWDLPALDTFQLNQAIYDISDADFRQNLAFYTDVFEVGDLLKVPVRQLSLGERMKMELIASLLHNPRVLFLDEPTIGLDAIAQRKIRSLLKTVNREQGITVLLTSHYMKDISSLCERVLVIRQGAKIYDGKLDALMNQHKEYVEVALQFSAETDWHAPDFAREITRTPFRLAVQVARDQMQRFLQTAIADCPVADIQIEEKDMSDLAEEIFQMEAVGTEAAR
ncbi:MAG: ATP-binding cassette domain-containing protein [Anaerolineaceae bacterium]|nr:ATP-binding cassette domain-containing protein [Anaerolineaceae bacterium]